MHFKYLTTDLNKELLESLNLSEILILLNFIKDQKKWFQRIDNKFREASIYYPDDNTNISERISKSILSIGFMESEIEEIIAKKFYILTNENSIYNDLFNRAYISNTYLKDDELAVI
jgi:hypothetical protein